MMTEHTHHSHDAQGEMQPASPTDRPSVHGMFLFGEENIYLSHLPMFMSPHDYQAILAVNLTSQGSDPRTVYVQDRVASGEKVYTFVPERFVLTDLVSPSVEQPRRSSFTGTPFRGHFERGGQPLLIPTAGQPAAGRPSQVGANVTGVICFRKFDPEAGRLPALTYLLFGRGTETFLAHVITRPPDFDQILSVEVAGHDFTDEELRHGVPITFPSRENAPEMRIKEGEQVAGRLQSAGPTGDEPQEVTLVAGVEFYFETGDLAEAM